ncbi:MAG: helix-turn-helix transcriptional regulator [Bacteroidota bacterium]
MNIGLAIRFIRTNLNVSQKELSRACGLAQTSLSQIENNIKKPQGKTIQNICKALDVPESIIYILAMEEKDISQNKRIMYQVVHPSITNLALQMIQAHEPEPELVA